MLKLASLIFRNVFRNKRRSLLTLASTAVSLGLLAFLLAVYQGMFYGDDVSPAGARRVVCRHRVSLIQPLPASHLPVIRQVPGVQIVSSWTWFQGTWKDSKFDFARFAADAPTVFGVHPDWIVASDQKAAFERDRIGCAVAQKIADQYKMHLGDRITIVGDIYPVTLELKIDAIFQHPRNTECLVFHQEYLTELLPKTSSSRDMVGFYVMLADTPDHVASICRAIDTRFDNSPYPTRTESEKEFGRSFLAFLGDIKLFLAAVCGAVTFTILLVSANTIAMAVRERTRETAILRTLGYTPGEILQLITGEAILTTFFGGLLGVAGGWALSVGLQHLADGVETVKWQAGLIVVGMSLLVGFFASLIPAWMASKKNVVDSLRFAG